MTSSALYEGWVAHRRLGPVPHSFRYRVFYPLLDLDELPELLDRIPLWSARRPAPARFSQRDYLPGAGGSLSDRARDLAEARLGRRPAGPVRVLANPRYLGVGFNPLALYFLYAPGGDRVDAVIAEVTSTPWGERTTYVLEGDGSPVLSANFDKRMHVSPFQPLDQRYAISVTAPGERLAVEVRNEEPGRTALVATLALRRRPLTRGRLLRSLFSYPPMTAATLARIYANALRLAVRGASYHPHPGVMTDDAASVSLTVGGAASLRRRSSGRRSRGRRREPRQDQSAQQGERDGARRTENGELLVDTHPDDGRRTPSQGKQKGHRDGPGHRKASPALLHQREALSNAEEQTADGSHRGE